MHVHNEEAGAFAASAEAQLTGRLAVCAGSCGPGNTHLIQGLYDANRTGAPVLALASHIPTFQIGTSFFQETRPEWVFMDASEWCDTLSSADQMPRLLRIAIQEAVAKQAVSVLVVPGNVADLDVGHQTGTGSYCMERGHLRATSRTRCRPSPTRSTRRRRSRCSAAPGCATRSDEVMALAETVKAPIGHSLRGKEWIQYDNPYDVGMTGLLGYGACRQATHDADLLVLLGTDFPYESFLPGTRTVQVDADASRLGRRSALEVAVHGDVGETLRALVPLVEPKVSRRFLDDMLTRHERALTRVVDAYTGDRRQRMPIHPEYVADVLDDLAADDAIFTVDTGMNNVWAARYLTPNGRRRVIGSFLHGTMANALPHAIGAACAYPGRQVVAMSGDGGLSMLLGELLTVRMHDLPITIVVFNNSALSMVELEMLVEGLPPFGTDNGDVNYAEHRGRSRPRSDPRHRPARAARRPREGVGVGGTDARRRRDRSERAVTPAPYRRATDPWLRDRRREDCALGRRREDARPRPCEPPQRPRTLRWLNPSGGSCRSTSGSRGRSRGRGGPSSRVSGRNRSRDRVPSGA